MLGGAAASSGVGGASFGSTARFSFRRRFRAGFATDGGRFSSSSSSSSSSSPSSPSACASSSAIHATSIAGSRSAVASATAARHWRSVADLIRRPPLRHPRHLPHGASCAIGIQ